MEHILQDPRQQLMHILVEYAEQRGLRPSDGTFYHQAPFVLSFNGGRWVIRETSLNGRFTVPTDRVTPAVRAVAEALWPDIAHIVFYGSISDCGPCTIVPVPWGKNAGVAIPNHF